MSAPGPLDEVPGAWEALDDLRKPAAEMARIEPHRARRAVMRNMEPILADPASMLGVGRGSDAALLGDPGHGAMLRDQIAEGLRPGAEGIASDLLVTWCDWGFRLGDIDVPTAVFHGGQDPYNAVDAHAYAELIPGASFESWPDGGHLAIISHWEDVLDAALRLRSLR